MSDTIKGQPGKKTSKRYTILHSPLPSNYGININKIDQTFKGRVQTSRVVLRVRRKPASHGVRNCCPKIIVVSWYFHFQVVEMHHVSTRPSLVYSFIAVDGDGISDQLMEDCARLVSQNYGIGRTPIRCVCISVICRTSSRWSYTKACQNVC